MSSSRASIRVEYVVAKYCKDTCGSLSPHPNRPLSREGTQQPRDVRKLFPRHRREAPQHTPSVVAPQALQLSPPALPNASLQKTISASGPLHNSTFDDDVSDPANVEKHVKSNLVGHLTSLLFQRQGLEAQLCNLESMIREHSPPGISIPARKDTSRQPLTERLAGILPSSMNSLRITNHSTYPSYSMPLAEFIDDAPFGVKHVSRPAPLNPRSSQSGDHCTPQCPHLKGTCKVIRDWYQETLLKLAAVGLEVELVYLSADRQSARSTR